MAVIRVNKTKDYSVISNRHLRDKNLSFKAKGLLSLMLSLPDDWDYSIAGLETFASDGSSATRSALKELEAFGYLTRRPIRENGRIKDWEYNIFEIPQAEISLVENQQVEKRTQQNKEQQTTDQQNTKKERSMPFTPPTLEEVKAYCLERKNKVDAERFIDFYQSKGWFVGKNKMKDWKAAVRTWEKEDAQKGKDADGYMKHEYTEEQLYGAFYVEGSI